jgi:hypothetical protein
MRTPRTKATMPTTRANLSAGRREEPTSRLYTKVVCYL